jgi:hypothetical protein
VNPPPEAQQQLPRPRKLWLLRSGTWTICGAGCPGAPATPGRRHLRAATLGSPRGAIAPGQRQLRGLAPGTIGRAKEQAAPAGPELAAIPGTRAGSVQSEQRGVGNALEGGSDIKEESSGWTKIVLRLELGMNQCRSLVCGG